MKLSKFFQKCIKAIQKEYRQNQKEPKTVKIIPLIKEKK